MDEPISKFSINTVREFYLFGEGPHIALLQRLVKAFYFLAPRPGKDYSQNRPETHFVVAPIDFSNPPLVQTYVKLLSELTSPLAHKVAFVLNPDDLSDDQLLLMQEIGVRYVAMGAKRNEEFKDYVKRISLELHQIGTLDPYATELDIARRNGDMQATRRVAEKLKDLPVQSEEVLRMLAVAWIQANDFRRAEVTLRKLLALNAQNLWAANMLGRFYLKSGRVAEGVELLERLSKFHELNAERNLVLGDAYVSAGQTEKAEEHFAKGEALTDGADQRFRDGLAKAKLSAKDYVGAMALMSGRQLSAEVISYLNMRAILCIRGEKYTEGIEYYKFAFDGTGADDSVKAKLQFNMGIAYVRTQDWAKAEECFKVSAELGGKQFPRAQAVLRQVRTHIKAQAAAPKGVAKAAEKIVDELADADWETLY